MNLVNLVNLLPVADTRREQSSSAAREMRVTKPRQAPPAGVKRINVLIRIALQSLVPEKLVAPPPQTGVLVRSVDLARRNIYFC